MSTALARPERIARWQVWSTTVSVVVTDPAALPAAEGVLREGIEAWDRACSRFREDSELSRLNAAHGRPVAVSERLLDEVQTALRAARVTEGLLDPTVGATLRLLGYDRDFAALGAEDQPITVRARPVPGWHAVQVDSSQGTIRVPVGVELDLGATAKASCADWVAARAATLSGCGVLASLGGDVAAAGPPPESGWPVRVADRHDGHPAGSAQTVAVRSGGLATSGTAARRWRAGGRVVHHLIDPATGLSALEHWRTASVAAGSCVDANIASTASIILGPAAPAWLEERRLPARLVRGSGAVVRVAGWPPPQKAA